VTHEEMSELYELYALGVLEGEERAEIGEHLGAGCDVCRAGLQRAAMQNVAILAALTPEAAPSRRVRGRLLAGMDVAGRAWGRVAWGAAMACLVAVAWTGVRAYRMSTELQAARQQMAATDHELARVRLVLDVLNAPDTRAVVFGQEKHEPPRGSVFVNPRSGVLLIASRLPQLASGKIYEMWVIPKGGAPKPAGLFRSTAAGTAMHSIAGPVDMETTGAVAVTVEPAAGSNAPTSTPIIVAPVAGL
jgi:anti-sigma-K factor RskA